MGAGVVFTSDPNYHHDGFKSLNKTHSFKQYIAISDKNEAPNYFWKATGTQWTMRKIES